jgi:hypothetical protein
MAHESKEFYNFIIEFEEFLDLPPQNIGLVWQHFSGQFFAFYQKSKKLTNNSMHKTLTNYFHLYVASEPESKKKIL